MNIFLVRSKNLDYLIRKEKSAAEFARKIDMSKSQLSQLRSTKNNRTIGNLIARKIEEKLNLTNGWMDEIHHESLSPEDIAELSMINAGFTVSRVPNGTISLNWERWTKADFVVTNPEISNLSVYVDIHARFNRLGVPYFPDNSEKFVYICNEDAHKAGETLLNHFKKWAGDPEGFAVPHTQTLTDDELKILEMYRSQTQQQKETILSVLAAMTKK